jgi:hypothetical protein
MLWTEPDNESMRCLGESVGFERRFETWDFKKVLA